MVSYEEFVRFLEEKTYNKSWNTISPSVEKFIKENASKIPDAKAFRQSVHAAMINEITSGKLPNTKKNLLNWWLPKCRETLNPTTAQTTGPQTQTNETASAKTSTQPNPQPPTPQQMENNTQTIDQAAQPGQPKEGAPGKTDNHLYNSEFLKVTEARINEIGHEEILNHTQDIKNAFSKDLRSGITSIDYIEIKERVQENKEELSGSRLQEFKRLKEEDAPRAQNSSQVSQDSQSPQKNPRPEVKSGVEQSKGEQSANMLKALKTALDKPSAKLDLPQTLTFRVSFAPNTMYWILRSYGSIGEKLALFEAVKKKVGELGKEEKLESLQTAPENLRVIREAESYLKLLLEDTNATESEEKKNQEEADKNARKLAREIKKSNKQNLKNAKKEAETSEEKKSLILKDIKLDDDSVKRTKYFKEFIDSVSNAEEEIVKHLQKNREEEVAKHPKEQQPYIPNYEVARENSKEYSYFGNENLIKELQEAEKIAESVPLDITKAASLQEVEEASSRLTPIKEKILQLSKDPNNCRVDLKVNMIPWDKKPSTAKRLGTAVLGSSPSAKEWSKIFGGI